jgi:hypothetical protein
MARERFEERGRILVRIGLAPKRAILLCTDEPFAKLTANFVAPNDSEHKIEVLANGQQIVVQGIHPNTRRPYSWFGGEPGPVERDELPRVCEADMRSFLNDAVRVLREQYDFKIALQTAVTNTAVRPATPWQALANGTVGEGGRNNALTRVTGHLLRRYVDPELTLSLVRCWNHCHCQPPLDDAEVVKTVNSVAAKELRRRNAHG